MSLIVIATSSALDILCFCHLQTEESELFKDDNFFDALSRFQAKRINDQRFSFGEEEDTEGR